MNQLLANEPPRIIAKSSKKSSKNMFLDDQLEENN